MPVLQGNIIIQDFSTNILKLTSENPVGFFNDYYLIKNGTRIVISNDPALTGWYTLIAHTGVSYQFWYGQVTSPVTIDGDQFEYILENWVYDTSKVQKNNTYVAQNQTLNFIEGANITLTITDDYPNKRTNIQIDASGGGGGVTTFSAGTTGLTPVAPTAGAVTLGGTLAITNGGTGLTALGAATNYLRVNPAGTALEYWPFPTIPTVTPSALTASNDTNITLTLGGTPATALLQATSITAGWTGTLAISRGGTALSALGTALQYLRVNAGATALEYVTGSALSVVNDTNLSISLSGTPATALLQPVTLNLGWTGTLSIGRGGTNLNTLGTALQYLRVKADASGLEYATFPSIPGGTVTSVSASVPSPASPAYSVTVTNPTTTPAIAITANGATSQYVRGDGSLATFPSATTVSGRTGDVIVNLSGSNYEVRTVVSPFLLMGG